MVSHVLGFPIQQSALFLAPLCVTALADGRRLHSEKDKKETHKYQPDPVLLFPLMKLFYCTILQQITWIGFEQ